MSPDAPSQTPSTPLTLLQATGAGRRIRNTPVTSELERAGGRGNPQDTLEHCSPAPGRDPNCEGFQCKHWARTSTAPPLQPQAGCSHRTPAGQGQQQSRHHHIWSPNTAHRASNGGEPHTTRSPVAPRFLQRFPRAHAGPPHPKPWRHTGRRAMECLLLQDIWLCPAQTSNGENSRYEMSLRSKSFVCFAQH